MKGFLEKLFIIEGILFGFIGVLFFASSFSTFIIFVKVIALILLIIGVFTSIRAFLTPYPTFIMINGFLSILFGAILLFATIETMDTLAIFFGTWTIIRGVYLFIMSVKYKNFGINFNTIYNVILIALGLWIFFNPIIAILATQYIIGSYFIITALCEIYLGLQI